MHGRGLRGLPGHAQDNRIDTIRADAPELAKYGKHAVGVKTLNLVNPGQADIVKFKAGAPMPVYDRPLTVEVWYPAAPRAAGNGQYRAFTRDGKTEVTLTGRALRDVAPDRAAGPYPLLIISHGYPGNRFLLSHLAENLASKGYVVASIDHTDSTYSDQAAFGSTLLNRPLDQLFVLREMARLHQADPSGTLQGHGQCRPDRLDRLFDGRLRGGQHHRRRLHGRQRGAPLGDTQWRNSPCARPATRPMPHRWTSASRRPWRSRPGAGTPASGMPQAWPASARRCFFVAGSVDDVSGYAPGVRNIFEASINAPRFLLTFDNANHNAAAPMPAPRETWLPVPGLRFVPAEHYIDAVWDNVRMNNIAQHFATAFLDKYLKNDTAMDAYLNILENPRDGKWSAETNGSFKA